MNEDDPFQRIAFSPDFSAGRRADGTEITFTRSESEILRFMSERPGRTITRNQLLDAISGEGSDKSDRNIDYVISRIRRKLAEDPKDPKYILTRYGEGYRWLGEGRPEVTAETDVLIGPLRGIDGVGRFAANAQRFAQEFYRAVSDDLPDGRSALFAPDPTTGGRVRAHERSIDLTFFTDADELECILTVRRSSSDSVLAVSRKRVGDGPGPIKKAAEDAAQLLLGQTWRNMVVGELDSPLPVAMHDAAGLPVGENAGSWQRNDRRLKRLLEEEADDPILQLFYATHLHSKYVILGSELFFRREDTCQEDEDRMEELVLSALPGLRQPTHRIMAAKLLYFLDRGYDQLATEMAEEGLKQSTSIASSLAIVGQMRSFAGRREAAVRSIDQAVRLSEFGSEFHVYTLFIRCQILAAAGDWDGLATARKELQRVRPATAIFEPMFTDPFKPSFRSRTLIMALSRARARSYLAFFNYVSTRLFKDPEMRANSVRAVLRLLIGRFGEDVVPDDLRKIVPDLVDELARRRKSRQG